MNHKKTKHNDEYIKAENVETGEVRYFVNGRRAAEGLGCSHVLVYNVISGTYSNTAKGWKLCWISRNAEEVNDFRRFIEEEKERKELEKTKMIE